MLNPIVSLERLSSSPSLEDVLRQAGIDTVLLSCSDTRSLTRRAKCKSWVVRRSVISVFFKMFSMTVLDCTSRCAVGSSRRSSSGFGDENAPQGETFLLPTGKVPRPCRGELAELGHCQHGFDAASTS